MREHPIIMSGESIRAILDGWKTQTRRVVAKSNSEVGSGKWEWLDLAEAWPDVLWGATHGLKAPTSNAPEDYCPECVSRVYPRWEKGDRLWVREAIDAREPIARYTADETMLSGGHSKLKPKIISPIHMPRWACRLTLEVTDVRVERLQEISELDCYEEGRYLDLEMDPVGRPAALGWFRPRWDSINAKRGHSWESNPWVWVIAFKPEPNP